MLILKNQLHQSINSTNTQQINKSFMIHINEAANHVKPAKLKSRQTSLYKRCVDDWISNSVRSPIQCRMICACDRKSRECLTCVLYAYCISAECQKGLRLIYSFDTSYYLYAYLIWLMFQKYWSRFCVHWSFFFKLSHWPLHFHKYLWPHLK